MNTVFLNVQPKDITSLLEHGFTRFEPGDQYQIVRYKKPGVHVTLYHSGKLVVQHSTPLGKAFSHLQKKPQKEATPQKNYDSQHIFGSDETLKGDTFGGLIVAGFSYTPDLREELEGLGLQDSKRIRDERIQLIAQELLQRYPKRCVVRELTPKEYNVQLRSITLTQLMNTLHRDVAKHKEPQQLHLVDKFPGCTAGDEAIPKAESCSLAVAAASILARAQGLQQFEQLSSAAGFRLPLGSTHVTAALQQLLEHKLPVQDFVKLHFKNVQATLAAPKERQYL